MSRGYDQLAWVDYPETLTPISAANLNRMENGIANLYSDRNKLESNMAYVEDGDTSSRHYDIDAYLMHNGVFYKVTEEINIGDTLDYGLDGNIAHVDISSQFSSTGCVELTQSQYDALPEEDKMADIIYLITDSPDNRVDLDEVFGDFATVEATSTASKAYEAGDYLVYDNKFYKVTTAIAQGDTIVTSGVSANVEQTTVGDEMSNSVIKTELYSTDLNNITTPGFYYVDNRTITLQNVPFENGFGTLVVFNSGELIHQIIFQGPDVIWQRRKHSTTDWSPWYKAGNGAIGTWIVGTNTTPTVSASGGNADISTMSLTKGTWILFCNGYSPIMINNNVTGQATAGTFLCRSGTADIRAVASSLSYEFSISGPCIVSTDAATIAFHVTNWESTNITATSNYCFSALRIA